MANDSSSKGGGLTSALGDAAKSYASAQGSSLVGKIGDKLSGLTDSLESSADGGGFKPAAAGEAARRLASGDNPAKAALGGVASGVKEKVSGMFGGGGKGKGKRPTNIVEDILVGVPVDVAYNQWTQYQEMPSYSKGPQSVTQDDEVTTKWTAKIALSSRSWTSTITEQVPDRRIAWSSEGDKGTVDGVVTFHPLADDLTQVLMVLEYRSKGPIEWIGNRWRTVGRRVRLDLKHYRRFVMMQGEATGAWRGEIEDGEVVRSHDEVVESEEQENQDQLEDGEEPTDEESSGEEPDEEYDEGEEPEDEYDEEGEEPDEEYDEEEESEGEEPEDEYEDEEPEEEYEEDEEEEPRSA